MRMRIFLLFLGLALFGQTRLAAAIAYQAGSGVLSYTFFNLSPSDCTLTPLGAGYASNGPAWNGEVGSAGFFNSPFGGNYSNPESLVRNNYIFYNGEDPIATGAALPIAKGGHGSGIENSLSFDHPTNPAAMGDLWTLNCAAPTGQGTTTAPPTQLLGTLATATNLLVSNTDAPSGSNGYPYNQSLSGVFQNAGLSPFGAGGCGSASNPCGIDIAGFDPTAQAWSSSAFGAALYNLNTAIGAADYAPTGGLWMGVNSGVPTTGQALAVNTVNAAMFPVNLASYVASSNFNASVTISGQGQVATSIYGGHQTLALGDPFVVNGYAAKMLWFLVTNTTLNNGTQLNALQQVLSPAAGAASRGVFQNGSYEDQYVNWLFGSPALAASAYVAAFQAASTPVTHESIWGRIFAGLADAAAAAVVAALIAIPGADLTGVAALAATAAAGAGTGVAGGFVPDMNNAISSAFTSTVSGAPPQAQNAPPVINATYASSNLLGMLLTNVAVQNAIQQAMTAAKLNPAPQPNPYFSNYSIYIDSLCTNLGLSNNLLSGNCTGSSGATQPNGLGWQPVGSYGNVNSTPTGNASTALSIWDAILTGSDVTTNESGQMIMGTSVNGMASFSPPLQMLNATNGASSPALPLSVAAEASSSFNLQTGVITLNAYGGNGGLGDPMAPGPTAPPLAAPQVNSASGYPVGAQSYDSATGILTVSSYQYYTQCSTYYASEWIVYSCWETASFSNGPQSIDLTGCVPNAQVTLMVLGGAGSLSCTQVNPVPGSQSLAYAACVNDPWATGGVYAAVTEADASGNPLNGVVACACVPAYLDGPSASLAPTANLLGGVVVGATSQNPSQQCPPPTGG